jgi:hypothetical protein
MPDTILVRRRESGVTLGETMKMRYCQYRWKNLKKGD